jgi:hypothetical protein
LIKEQRYCFGFAEYLPVLTKKVIDFSKVSNII